MSALVTIVCLALAAAPLYAEDGKASDAPSPAEVEFFEKQIRPLFVENCHDCHAGDASEGGLNVESLVALIRGGDSGPALVAGKPGESRLVEAIRYGDPDLQMPPDGKLGEQEIAAVVKWVEMGAPWPGNEGETRETAPREEFKITAEDRAHWSLRPVVKPALPEVQDRDWPRSPVDRFILARLEANGLEPAAPADKATLLRRVYLDLVGLPPTPQQQADFLTDDSPHAFERVVDELLASPRYGEKWARHWLDVVRYSETAGHVQDRERPHSWRYRDYVIDAFNDDLPFDRFIREHIAGDLLSPRPGKNGEANVAPVATGFLWFHEMHFRPVDPVAQRADQVDAQIDTLGKAFLGLTLGCARCHDHKFDPISQRDYYSLAGFLHSTDLTHRRLAPRAEPPADEERAKKIAELEEQIQSLVDKSRAAVRGRQSKKTDHPVPISEDNFPPNARAKLAELRGKLAELDPSSALWARAATDVEGRDVRLHIRGSHKNLGDKVPRSFLEVLSDGPPEEFRTESGRLYLAGAIADPHNPLPARVMANRLWQEHFGRGLVRTANNFGRQAEPPSHPELLDYLAVRFRERGWSLKSLHRLMVLSSTYRMSSRATGEARRRDPGNRLLSHMPVRRLQAELIRDSILHVAGSLDTAVGGPSIPPYISPNATANKPIHLPKAGPLDGAGRRSVYLKVRRNYFTPFLETFDFPDAGASVGRRDVTIVPSQALAMLNSPFVHQQAGRWGRRVAESASTPGEKLEAMFLRALCRPPSSDERERLAGFVQSRLAAGAPEEQVWSDVAHVVFNMNEFIFVR